MDRRLAPLLASLACLLGAAAAQASDRVYWSEGGLPAKILFANADGTGEVQALTISGTTINGVEGAVIDPGTNRIYWVNRIGNEGNRKIRFANLDGSGGGELNIAGASNNESTGLAIDPVGRKIYWADRAPGKISFARLDGSGGGTLQLPQGSASFPSGVAIDPAARRIWWVNSSGPAASAVGWANLDGPGGGSVPIGTAPRNSVHGAAIDPVDRRIYWANLGGNQIGFANLDGSGGSNLITTGATVSLAAGIAIDPIARRVYWANRAALQVGGTISFANLNGSGGGDLFTGLDNSPQFPLLLFGPKPTAPPAISGSSQPGSQLACSAGTWSGDALEAFFYRSPQRFTYRWSRNGVEIAGATSATHTAAPAGGEYRCRVTGENVAGSASETSQPHRVGTARGSLRLKLAASRIRPGAPLRVAILNPGPVDVAGSLSGRAKVKPAGKPRRFAKLAGKPFQVAAGARAVVRLRLPKAVRLQLLSRGKLPVTLRATFAASGGPQQATTSTLKPSLRSKPG